MPDTASEKGKGTKLFNLVTENFPVPVLSRKHTVHSNKVPLCVLLVVIGFPKKRL